MNDELLNKLVEVAENMVSYEYGYEDEVDVRYVDNWPEVVKAIVTELGVEFCGQCRLPTHLSLLQEAPSLEGGQTVAPWCYTCRHLYYLVRES